MGLSSFLKYYCLRNFYIIIGPSSPCHLPSTQRRGYIFPFPPGSVISLFIAFSIMTAIQYKKRRPQQKHFRAASCCFSLSIKGVKKPLQRGPKGKRVERGSLAIPNLVIVASFSLCEGSVCSVCVCVRV